MHIDGVPVITLQISNPGEDVLLEDIPVVNASTIAALPAGEAIYLCMPTEKEVPLAEAPAAIAFQAAAIVAHSQAYGGSHQRLERMARMMTETLECVLLDFDQYLQSRPDQQEEGGREGVINPYSHEQWDIAEGFTTSKFLVAIVGVARIYQEFNSTQTAQEMSLEYGQPWTEWGHEADVTPEIGQFFRWYTGRRGLAGDVKISFVGWCDSAFHKGPNAYLPHHLYTQHLDPSRAKHCCYQCFWREHGE